MPFVNVYNLILVASAIWSVRYTIKEEQYNIERISATGYETLCICY